MMNTTKAGGVVATYLLLRRAIGWIGLLLPIVVIVGDAAFCSGPLPNSLSDFYYTPMRNILVGALCVLGVFLLLYDVSVRVDRWITNAAGMGVLGVAFLPGSPQVAHLTTSQEVIGNIHVFFAAIAFVAPSIAIGVISTAFTDPGTAVGLLSTYGILGLVLMYLMANIALIAAWARFRRAGVRKNVWGWVVTPVIGILVLAIPIWGDLRPGQPAPYSYLPWLTIALIAAGVVYMLILSTVRPRVMEHAVANLEGEIEGASAAL